MSYAIGKYQILDELGFGGMGTVYRALDPVLDREVALKTLVSQGSLEDDARRRFLREARSVARLQHPNIITVYEFGEVSGIPFIAMEILGGCNLDDAVAGGLVADVPSRLQVVEQLCCGLAYAHSRGVIHRDVKPSNIHVLPDGTVKVLDFGIAWLEGGTFITKKGVVLGTPSYMAPEQFTSTPIDHRVDMWAVGVILYELLTGRRPFEARTVPSLIYKIIHAPVPPPEGGAAGLPQRLVELVETSLAKNPEDRFHDLGVMQAEVQAVLREEKARLQQLTHTVSMFLAVGDTTRTVEGLEVEEDPEPSGPSAGAAPPATPSASAAGPRPFRGAGLFGERSGLQTITVSPDERLLVIGGVDGSLRLWDLETRMKLTTLRSRMHLRTGHGAMTTALGFAADGSLLAAGHLDGSIYVWDPISGLEAEARLRHDGAVSGLAFTGDAKVLVSGGMDATLKLWEVPAILAGEARRVLRRQPADVTALVVCRSLVLTGHANRSVRMHEIASSRLVATLHGHSAAVGSMAVSRRGDLLATGSRDGLVRVFGIDERLELRRFQGHSRSVSSLFFFPGGRRLASVARDHALMIWDLPIGGEQTTLWGEADEDFVSVAVIAGGERIVCGLADGRVRLWEAG